MLVSQNLVSGTIKLLAYDADSYELLVVFKPTGESYLYEGVPFDVWELLHNTAKARLSVGTCFNIVIKKAEYKYTKVT